MKNVISIVMVAGTVSAANAQLGVAVSETGANNFVSETITVAPGYDGQGMLSTWGPGDMFGITSRPTATGVGLPFAIADDSNGSFPTDDAGIIDANDNGFFFGIVDSVNGDNPAGNGTAQWDFDITGATGISVNADFAAMGDFEVGSDIYDFTYSIDGSTPSPLFTSSIDDTTSQNYTLAGGTTVSLDDPALVNGNVLSNVFQNISTAVTGSGSTLTIAFNGESNGGSEAFAFRNLTVVPTPGSAALMGLAGVAGLRRRRA